MSLASDIDQIKQKHICFRCVGESYLSQEMKKCGVRKKCAYCNKVSNCYSIGEFSERIDTVFDEHFALTSDQPNSWQFSLLSDKESSYDWERDGEPVIYAIMNAADIPENAAEDIQRILDDQYGDFDAAAAGEETPYSSESYYEEKGSDDSYWQEEWQSFERSLKKEARFFSQSAANYLFLYLLT